MTPPLRHQASEQWIQTIERNQGYTAIDARTFQRFIRRMKSYAIYRAVRRYVKPGETALEAGCGWGLNSFALAREGRNVTALDIAPTLVADLKRVQGELGEPYVGNLTIVEGDIFRLSELQKTFDAVFSDGTYEHFLDPEDRKHILQSIKSVLKGDGILIIAVPNLGNPFFGNVVDERMPAMHLFSLQTLATELERGGFQILERGYSFVNPGFEQWVQKKWMILPIRLANAVFRFLPRPLKSIVAAHLYCVARRTT